MHALARHPRLLMRLLSPAICLALVGYFGFHAAYGERGLLALRALDSRLHDQQVQLQELQQRRHALERRVALISGPGVDGDILEEEVRALLGWTGPDEIVILHHRPEASR
ncbi:FtsB family cell division protein [Minwuia sp.]|uniref:FtsB family cell division protein n=1 Tax=Minwuia sp. TaxID=2493630 RepID=UPI003A8F91AF